MRRLCPVGGRAIGAMIHAQPDHPPPTGSIQTDMRVDETRHVGDVTYGQMNRPPPTGSIQTDTRVDETRIGAIIHASVGPVSNRTLPIHATARVGATSPANGIRPNGHAGR